MAFSTSGEVLAVPAWNVKCAYGRCKPSDHYHTFSKYRVHIAYLSEARLLRFTSLVITNLRNRYWHCGASNSSGRNGVAIVISKKAHSIWSRPVLRVSSAISVMFMLQLCRQITVVKISSTRNFSC